MHALQQTVCWGYERRPNHDIRQCRTVSEPNSEVHILISNSPITATSPSSSAISSTVYISGDTESCVLAMHAAGVGLPPDVCISYSSLELGALFLARISGADEEVEEGL